MTKRREKKNISSSLPHPGENHTGFHNFIKTSNTIKENMKEQLEESTENRNWREKKCSSCIILSSPLQIPFKKTKFHDPPYTCAGH